MIVLSDFLQILSFSNFCLFVNRCRVYLPPGLIIPAACKHNTTDKRIRENNVDCLYSLEGENMIHYDDTVVPTKSDSDVYSVYNC